MVKRWCLIGLLMLTLLPVRLAQSQRRGVADERYARLARGVNLSGWFWNALTDDPTTRFRPAEFTTLRRLGFTFVRVPIALSYVLDDSPDLLHNEHLTTLEQAIEQLHAADLAVVVDLHDTDLSATALPYSGDMLDPAFVTTYQAFWVAFAARLGHFDPGLTFFSLYNEPFFWDNPADWLRIQADLVVAVRAVVPEHTLIVTSYAYSMIETLVQMTPLPDPNLIYDFHFYEPFLLTHQGAGWTWQGGLRGLHDIPYPSNPEVVAPLLAEQTGEKYVLLAAYGDAYWDRAKLDGLIAPAAAWATANGVRVICTEFGVFRRFADSPSRARWIRDVREILEGYGIGWAMWDYDEGFGLATHAENGRVEWDWHILRALGLG